MTVSELIKELLTHDPDNEVIISRDPEGNSYRTLYNIHSAAFDKDDSEVYLSKLTPELEISGYTQEDVRSDLPEVVVLY